MKKIIAIVSIILTLSFSIGQDAFAIGLVSDPIELNNVLRGQEIRDELRALNSEDKEVEFSLSASGDISEWVTFYEDSGYSAQITKIKIAAKAKSKAYLIIKVPDDAPNGKYEGGLSIQYDPAAKDQTSQTSTVVSQKATREVFLNVTDNEIIDFDASVTPQTYTLKENEILKINAIYYNKGNISIKPGFQVKIKKDGKVLFDVVFPYPEDEEGVKPLGTKTISSELPTGGLSLGEYKAETEVSLNGEIVRKDDFSFVIKAEDISEAGSSAEDSGIDLMNYAIIAATILAVVFLLLTTIKKKKANKDQNKNNNA